MVVVPTVGGLVVGVLRRIGGDLGPGLPSLQAMADIQLGRVSLFARAAVPLLLKAVEGMTPDAATGTALDLLRDWDGAMAADRPEPVVFAGWTAALHERLFADELGPLLPQYRRIRAATLLRILTDEPRWCDDRRTPAPESCADTVAGALSESMAAMTRRFGHDVTGWRWGQAHQAVFEHRVWSRVPVIGPVLERRAPTGGGDYTVDRGSWSPAEDPAFRHDHGASLRVLYDLADLDRSRFVATLGASGNPFSPHYSSWQKDWVAGRSFTIPAAPDDLVARRELAP